MSPQVITHSTQSKKVHVLAFGGDDATDKALLWKGTFTNPVGARKKHMVFRNVDYIISNWSGDDFANVIYITCTGVDGYYNKNVAVTERVAALELTDVVPTMDESSVRTYDLRYVLRDSQTWEIPLDVTLVKFYVLFDDASAPMELPLPNPILLNFEIRTE